MTKTTKQPDKDPLWLTKSWKRRINREIAQLRKGNVKWYSFEEVFGKKGKEK